MFQFHRLKRGDLVEVTAVAIPNVPSGSIGTVTAPGYADSPTYRIDHSRPVVIQLSNPYRLVHCYYHELRLIHRHEEEP